jgi:hypothetical protein
MSSGPAIGLCVSGLLEGKQTQNQGSLKTFLSIYTASTCLIATGVLNDGVKSSIAAFGRQMGD